MRRFYIARPLDNSVEARLQWCEQAIRAIMEAAEDNPELVVADQFSPTAPATKLYSLDPSTATLQNVADVLATFLVDLKARGET